MAASPWCMKTSPNFALLRSLLSPLPSIAMNNGLFYAVALAGLLTTGARGATSPIMQQANSWTAGQPLPRQLLDYRKSGLGEVYIPGTDDSSSVIGRITNSAVLLEMLFDTRIDPRVFAETVNRALHLEGPQAFFDQVKHRYQQHAQMLLFPLHKRLFIEMNQRHTMVDAMFISETEMPADKAHATLRQMISDMQAGKSWEAVYSEYSRNLRSDVGMDLGAGATPVTISKVSRFGPVVLCEQTKPEETLVSDPLPKEHRAALLQRAPGEVLLIGDPARRRVVLYRVREVYVPKLD